MRGALLQEEFVTDSGTNVETGTEWSGYGETFHARNAVFNILDDSFQVEQEVSRDGGETWFLAGKMTYTRK